MAEHPRVEIVEVGPRDGLQSEPGVLPTATKVEFIERAIAAGVRRIEAITGEAALRWVEDEEAQLLHIAQLVKSSREDLESKVIQLVERARKLEKDLDQLKGKLASATGSDLASAAVDVNGAKVLAAELEGADPKTLRETMDQLKNKLQSAVILLTTVSDGKVSLVAGVTNDGTDRIEAGDLVNYVAQQVGGRGGGRPDMAQAGGNDPAALEAALAAGDAGGETLLPLAARRVMENRMEEALELLIELMKRDRDYGDQAARRGLLAVFELLGGSGDLVNRYRARMSNLLY